jgi:flagellar basal body rod protein FlgF
VEDHQPEVIQRVVLVDLVEETLQETLEVILHLKEVMVVHNSGQCLLTQQKLEVAEELEELDNLDLAEEMAELVEI